MNNNKDSRVIVHTGKQSDCQDHSLTKHTQDLRRNENTLCFSKSKIKDEVVTKLNSVKVLNFDRVGTLNFVINENKHFICFRVATSHKNALRLFLLSILNNYNTTC